MFNNEQKIIIFFIFTIFKKTKYLNKQNKIKIILWEIVKD